MNVTQNIPLAVGLVLISSFCFALSAHLQHHAVDTQLSGNAQKQQMSFRTFLTAVRKPRWLLGLVLLGVSAVLQVTALFFGVVVFGEQLTPRIMLGVLMILTAVTLIIAAKPLLQLVRRRIG